MTSTVFFVAFVAIAVLLLWLFIVLQSVSIYVYNSRWKGFHVEICKHVNPIIPHNGHCLSCTYNELSKQLIIISEFQEH